MHDASELARMLARNVVRLVRDLLPNGHREGAEWMHASLAGASRRSLSVRLSGMKQGVWADFSSGDAGDSLDLVASVQYLGDKRKAIAWARSWMGVADATTPTAERRMPAAPPGIDGEAEARRRAARRLLYSAQAAIGSTPVGAYLAARGIDLADLGSQPRSRRFHPALPNRESKRPWPALLAAVVNAADEMVAVNRTWLQQDDGCWIKARLCNPKMSLGPLSGGTIRLWHGASRKPLAQTPDGEVVVVAEGIETALSGALLCLDLRVLSAVSLPNMARIVLPPAVRSVIIAADNDGDNQAAARGPQRAIDRFKVEGRLVRIARSPVGKDFNDVLNPATPRDRQ